MLFEAVSIVSRNVSEQVRRATRTVGRLRGQGGVSAHRPGPKKEEPDCTIFPRIETEGETLEEKAKSSGLAARRRRGGSTRRALAIQRRGQRKLFEAAAGMSYYPPAGTAASAAPGPTAIPSSALSASPSPSSDLDLVAALSAPSTQPALKANGQSNLPPARSAADRFTSHTAAAQAVEPLSRLLLGSAEASVKKVALAGFASAYPFLFRYA